MPPLYLLWIVTPFAAGALIGASPPARRFVCSHFRLCLTAGWLGVAMLLLAALALDGTPALVALGAGGPLAGLSYWSRGGGGDGGGPDDEPRPAPPEPEWERFLSDFWAHVDAHGAGSRRSRERVPAG
jgi:hypothetical protein